MKNEREPDYTVGWKIQSIDHARKEATLVRDNQKAIVGLDVLPLWGVKLEKVK